MEDPIDKSYGNFQLMGDLIGRPRLLSFLKVLDQAFFLSVFTQDGMFCLLIGHVVPPVSEESAPAEGGNFLKSDRVGFQEESSLPQACPAFDRCEGLPVAGARFTMRGSPCAVCREP
jgi:hypothetical protein